MSLLECMRMWDLSMDRFIQALKCAGAEGCHGFVAGRYDRLRDDVSAIAGATARLSREEHAAMASYVREQVARQRAVACAHDSANVHRALCIMDDRIRSGGLLGDEGAPADHR